jgi:hypothetical protein
MGTAMPPSDDTPKGDDPVVDVLWKAHRRRMLDIAFRILLDLGEAEDVVQEAFSRLARTAGSSPAGLVARCGPSRRSAGSPWTSRGSARSASGSSRRPRAATWTP